MLLSAVNLVKSDGKPLLQELLVPKSIGENQTIRLNCNLMDGSDVKLEWLFNNTKINDSSRRKIRLNEDAIDLTIKSLQIEDLGEYRCSGSNRFGQDVKKVSLFFNGLYQCKL